MHIERKFYILNSHKIAANSYIGHSATSATVHQTNYSTTALNTILKNRHALPNLPMQSTFKSLLSIPINSPQSTQNASNSKVYFRPQDLSSSNNRLPQATSHTSHNDLYSPKNIIEKIPIVSSSSSSTPLPPATSTTNTGRRISTKNLIINTSPSPSSPKNRILTPENEQRSSSTANVLPNPVITSPATLNTQSGPTATEQVNSMLRRTVSPSPGEQLLNTNSAKLKSWSNVPQNSSSTNKVQPYDTSRDKAQTPDSSKQLLTNWKSTVSNQSEKQIVIENTNVNNNNNVNNRPNSSRNTSPNKVSSSQNENHLQANGKLIDAVSAASISNKLTNLKKQLQSSNQGPGSHKNLDDFLSEKFNKINDGTMNGSDLETISNSTTATPKLSRNKSLNHKNDLGRIYPTMNAAKLNSKSSTNNTDNANFLTHSNLINNLKSNNLNHQAKVLNQITNITNTDPTLDRPPGRLNYYDSDTNTFSEGLLASNLLKRSNSEYLQKRLNKGLIILTIFNS